LIDVSGFERIDLDSDSPKGELGREARDYLMTHQWCWHVSELFVAADYGAVVLLAEFKPFVAPVGHEVWIITGDLPLSYMGVKSCETALEALGVYCALTLTWIQKTTKKANTKHCIKLTSHGDLGLLESVEDARSCIPTLTEVAGRLISDEPAFASLDPIIQEDLKVVQRIGTNWINRTSGRSDRD
jgi:hypothetical protein